MLACPAYCYLVTRLSFPYSTLLLPLGGNCFRLLRFAAASPGGAKCARLLAGQQIKKESQLCQPLGMRILSCSCACCWQTTWQSAWQLINYGPTQVKKLSPLTAYQKPRYFCCRHPANARLCYHVYDKTHICSVVLLKIVVLSAVVNSSHLKHKQH